MRIRPRNNLLHLAVIDNRPEEVKRLLKTPSLLSGLNKEGFTPLQLARLLGRKKCESAMHTLLDRTILIQEQGDLKPRSISIKEFTELFQVPYFDTLRFRSYSTLQLAVKSRPYILRIPGIENQELGEVYTNELKQGFVAPCSIRWLNDQIHYGLVADKDFDEGEWIGEYTGVVREYLRIQPDHNPYCLHYPTRFWSFRYFMIDAYLGGNETRFINHSDEPNLAPQCLVKDRLLHTVFFTSKKIRKGEQLTFDYGKDFWRHRKKLG